MLKRDPFELEELDQRLDQDSDADQDGPETCPACGEGVMMELSEYDGADADGNRGRWVDWQECNLCGYTGEDE